MTPDQESRLAAIEARNTARTQGEWKAYTKRYAEPVGKLVGCVSQVRFDWRQEQPTCSADFLTLPANESELRYPVGPNAAFIASCSVDVPWMLALIRKQAGKIARLTAMVERRSTAAGQPMPDVVDWEDKEKEGTIRSV